MKVFDYVIVGSGAAGSVLAYRLGEAGKSVCVLEAGPKDTYPFIRMPAGFVKTLFNPRVTWQLQHEGSPGTKGRPVHVAQGRTLGGSSSVNGMIYNRGQAADFDGWAQLGNPGWSYREVLPLFRRTERAINLGTDEYRGRNGRLPVTVCHWPNAVAEAFIAGAKQLGVPENDDYNGAVQAGTGYYQTVIYRNERWSAARTFLHPARKNFSVDVRVNARVVRVILEGKRAVGVVYRGPDDKLTEVRANTVILSAGAAHTPKVLQLSGIGPTAVLKGVGIDVKHELPGVGENFRDHLSSRMVGRAKPGVDSINGRVTGWCLGREFMYWALGRPSALALSVVQAYAFWKSDPSLELPDFGVSFTPGSHKKGELGRLDDFPGFTLGIKQMRPESQGYVRIRSADDRDPPILQPNFLTSEFDQRVAVEGLKWTRAVLHSAAMEQHLETEIFPGPSVKTDDEWLDFARQYGTSGFHLMGTAKMGPDSDPLAVVDPRLKVRGLEGLYVVDASIMPTMPSANTYASVLMIAEKASDMLLSRS